MTKLWSVRAQKMGTQPPLPPEMVPRLVTLMKHLHTIFAAISPFVSSQQNKDCTADVMKLASTRNFEIIHDFGTQLFISSEKCKKFGISRIKIFLWMLFSNNLLKDFCLLREDQWRNCGYFCKTGRPMGMLHMSDQSWNNSGDWHAVVLFSCTDRTSKWKHSFNGEAPSNNTKPT